MAKKTVLFAKRLSKFAVLSILFVVFMVFFMKDQLKAFLENRSSISSRHEIEAALEFPTITICIHPATKLSAAKKYGFTTIYDKFYKESSHQKP